jgi:16S rRNA (adenine1518-N6/adenine1519-N6)-dimethyltransferase
VVEVGAGLGSLTLALVGVGARVLAIEIDSRLAAILQDMVAGADVEVICADALRRDRSGRLAQQRGDIGRDPGLGGGALGRSSAGHGPA